MIKVDSSDKITNYKKVTNEYCPSFSGIVAGECKGNLWVDDIENPNIAIVESYAVGSYAFLGDIETDEVLIRVETFINDELFTMLRTNDINYFEFSIENDNLRKYILNMFSDKEVQKEKEYTFRKNNKVSGFITLPDKYTIHKINYEFWNLINEGSIDNRILVTERIVESWESFDEFFEKSLAFCILYSNKIVAVIVGTGRFNNIIAIDIETEEAHRHKGLGLTLTREFVNECITRGMTAQWDCVESNPLSQKLAQKAGFKFIKQNEVYWFDINKVKY